jgi:polyphosphate kinase
MRERILELIDRERQHAEAGRAARIIVKMNALVEPSVIDALYRASQAGVSIDLVIRGTCCLKPGISDFSTNIRVISVVDKFLEHSRIFYFENAGASEVFLGSADWMPRNFFRRIEVMFPVEDARLKTRLTEELLQLVLRDNVKARQLQSDGTYIRVRPADGEPVLRSQTTFQALARESAREAIDPAFRFVPILGPLAEKNAPGNGAPAASQRSKPARLRAPRGRKSPESR